MDLKDDMYRGVTVELTDDRDGWKKNHTAQILNEDRRMMIVQWLPPC